MVTSIGIDGSTFGGDKSDYIHPIVFFLEERRPRPAPPYLNIVNTFDPPSWLGMGLGFVSVSAVGTAVSLAFSTWKAKVRACSSSSNNNSNSAIFFV